MIFPWYRFFASNFTKKSPFFQIGCQQVPQNVLVLEIAYCVYENAECLVLENLALGSRKMRISVKLTRFSTRTTTVSSLTSKANAIKSTPQA